MRYQVPALTSCSRRARRSPISRVKRELLLAQLTKRVRGLVDLCNVVACAASPAERVYVERNEQGVEREIERRPPADIKQLQEHLWEILERDGKTLTAKGRPLRRPPERSGRRVHHAGQAVAGAAGYLQLLSEQRPDGGVQSHAHHRSGGRCRARCGLGNPPKPSLWPARFPAGNGQADPGDHDADGGADGHRSTCCPRR